MNLFSKQAFLIPLFASMLLLAGFIAYFLKSEYDKEKAAIVLETRDEAFVELFHNIRGAGPVQWMKDSLGNEVLIKLESSYDTSHRSNGDLPIDSILVHSHGNLKTHTEIVTIESRSDTMSFQLRDSLHPQKIKIRKMPLGKEVIDIDTNLRFEFNYFGKEGSNRPALLKNKSIEVSPIAVWKRLIPQSLFSLLLFGSMLLAYSMFSGTLKKERQLAHLRNDLMTNMSHELKTPISTISVALEALSDFNADDDIDRRKEYINITKAVVNRLGLLVDKSLNMSLAEQGKYIYNKQRMNLDETVAKVLQTLALPFENDQIKVTYNNPSSPCPILGDEAHITNVLHNLIENAIKYSDEQVTLDIYLEEKAQMHVLQISDQGKGIAQKYQDKIFDKFFRVPQGDKHNVKGHGLGLTYVKQVIKDHGGEITVNSKEGVGTTFIIGIPKLENKDLG